MVDEVSQKAKLYMEINKSVDKLFELEQLYNLNQERLTDIECEINKLNKKIECLENKKKKFFNYSNKVIATLSLLVMMPILLFILYEFVSYFGMKFLKEVDFILKNIYGIITMIGGGLIIFVGPISVREIINEIVKAFSNMMTNSLKYRNLFEEIIEKKEIIRKLSLDKNNLLKENNSIIFECSKYNALIKIKKYIVSNMNIDDDDSYDISTEAVKPYTRNRRKNSL